MKLTKQKSEEQAKIIELIKVYFPLLDIEYLRLWAKEVNAKADFYDSVAPLNKKWNSKGSGLLETQAQSVGHLIAFYESLVECDRLKKEMKKEDDRNNEITEMFSF